MRDLAAGSDWSVSSADPLDGIHVAVNRRVPGSADGRAARTPTQALSLASALTAYTAGSARVNHHDDTTGRIAEGFYADLAVLDRDPFASPADAIHEATVSATYVEGECVFRPGRAVVMTAKKQPARKALSRELILEAALGIVGTDDMNELTMSRLGRALDADPSAVYRHFRNKDELLLAMADVQMEEVVRTYEPGDDAYANLRHMMWVLRRSYLSRPGLARAVASRFTGGAAETVLVHHMIDNVKSLGYDESDAIARVRAVAEMTLGHIIMTAEVDLAAAQGAGVRARDGAQLLHPSAAAALAGAARGAARRRTGPTATRSSRRCSRRSSPASPPTSKPRRSPSDPARPDSRSSLARLSRCDACAAASAAFIRSRMRCGFQPGPGTLARSICV